MNNKCKRSAPLEGGTSVYLRQAFQNLGERTELNIFKDVLFILNHCIKTLERFRFKILLECFYHEIVVFGFLSDNVPGSSYTLDLKSAKKQPITSLCGSYTTYTMLWKSVYIPNLFLIFSLLLPLVFQIMTDNLVSEITLLNQEYIFKSFVFI